MAKLWVPTTVILVCALVLSVLVSLSLPWLAALDIARISTTDLAEQAMEKLDLGDIPFSKDTRFGVWTACAWDFDDKKTCMPREVGYEYPLGLVRDTKSTKIEVVTLTAGWTRGLAIHPVVTGVVGLALGASLSARHTVNLLTPIICVVAAAISLIGFIIDLALFLRVRTLVKGLGDDWKLAVNVNAGPGFWIALAVLVLCVVAAAILFVARRRELKGESAYPMLSTQFQKKGLFDRFKK